jgi:hypothetical protein
LFSRRFPTTSPTPWEGSIVKLVATTTSLSGSRVGRLLGPSSISSLINSISFSFLPLTALFQFVNMNVPWSEYHYTPEAVEARKIAIIYVPTEDMIADIFTKPLAQDLLLKFCKTLGLLPRRTVVVTKICDASGLRCLRLMAKAYILIARLFSLLGLVPRTEE